MNISYSDRHSSNYAPNTKSINYNKSTLTLIHTSNKRTISNNILRRHSSRSKIPILNEHNHELHNKLLITHLNEHHFQIITLTPLILQTENFTLTNDIETLHKIAELPTINLSVPMNAVLIFTAR